MAGREPSEHRTRRIKYGQRDYDLQFFARRGPDLTERDRCGYQALRKQSVIEPTEQTPEALGTLQKAEVEKWWPIIKKAGINQKDDSRRFRVPQAFITSRSANCGRPTADEVLGNVVVPLQATESGKRQHLFVYVGFSNRPFRVKRFQTIHHYCVDVAHGLVGQDPESQFEPI
jgi:hypothetical protein